MNDTNFEPRHRDMGRHITSGIFNSGIIQGVRILCQFGSVVILSRLLPPSDFGLLAMVGPINGFVNLFHDLGLSQATIQKPTVNHDEVNAFFWINAGIGALLTMIVMVISPLVGWYYGDPRLIPLTTAMALLIFVGALGNQPCAILTRRMEFQALSLNGAVGAISGLVVSIILALVLKNYWALYFGLLAGTLIPVIGVWFIARWRPSFPRHVAGLRDMLKFGAGITSANLSGFLSGNMDNVLIGYRWGDLQLGWYDRAYKLLLFPLQRMVDPVMGTMVPVLSRLKEEPDRYRRIFLKTVGQLTLFVWPGIIWAIILAETLIPTLLGKQWAPSAMIFVPLAMAGFLQVVNNSLGCLLISQGRSGELAKWSIFTAITCIAAFVIGLPYGPFGVATAYAVCECLRSPLVWWRVTRRGPINALDVLKSILPQLFSACVCALGLLIYRNSVHITPIFLLFGGLILSYGITIFVVYLFPSGRETLTHSLEAARKILIYVRTINRNGT